MTNLIQRARDVAGRLSRKHIAQTMYGGVGAGAFHSKPVNPDGAEAAAIIAELIERVEGVEGLS